MPASSGNNLTAWLSVPVHSITVTPGLTSPNPNGVASFRHSSQAHHSTSSVLHSNNTTHQHGEHGIVVFDLVKETSNLSVMSLHVPGKKLDCSLRRCRFALRTTLLFRRSIQSGFQNMWSQPGTHSPFQPFTALLLVLAASKGARPRGQYSIYFARITHRQADFDRPMSRIDYSKWEKMAGEMSDSDDDAPSKVEVTAFDEPKSVTFGGTSDPKKTMGEEERGGCSPLSSLRQTMPDAESGQSGEDGGTASTDQSIVRDSNSMSTSMLSENGSIVMQEGNAQRLHYVWRQTRTEVSLIVPVPAQTRAGEVQVRLKAKPCTISEGVAELLSVSLVTHEPKGGDPSARRKENASVTLLMGELAFQAKLDEEDGVDWELKDFPGTIVARDSSDETPGEPKADDVGDLEPRPSGSSKDNDSIPLVDRRGVEITLRKYCPVPGATLWWKSLLKGGPEIDVSAIAGRSGSGYQSAWEEALGMFKERVAERKKRGKIVVDDGR